MQDIIQNNISNINKTVKYILMGLIIIISLKYIPIDPLKSKEILIQESEFYLLHFFY